MFSKLTKSINLSEYEELSITVDKIKAQYNPDRFRFWKSLHEGPEEEVLNMIYSPHYRLLKQYVDQGDAIQNLSKTPYYNLQKLYGRNDKWIRSKMLEFINLFANIRSEGYKNRIAVLRKPLVKNKYNSGFEIYEGHHRLACCLVLGMEEIPCIILGGPNENN